MDAGAHYEPYDCRDEYNTAYNVLSQELDCRREGGRERTREEEEVENEREREVFKINRHDKGSHRLLLLLVDFAQVGSVHNYVSDSYQCTKTI